jgi:hypothetical protein
VSIQQALFIAPCSHAFHYKCLRPLLESNFPAFVCPLCRTFADLEQDVEVEEDGDGWEDADALLSSAPGPGTVVGRDDRERRDDPMAGGGAETEVEQDRDTGASRLGAGLRRLGSARGAGPPDLGGVDEDDEEARSLNGGSDGARSDGDADMHMLDIAARGNAERAEVEHVLAEDDADGFVAAMDALDAGAAEDAHRRAVSPARAGPSAMVVEVDGDREGTLASKRKR